MVEYKTIINNEGLIVKQCILFIDGICKNYTICENDIIIDFLDKTYIRPIWDFKSNKWIECATEKEIKLWQEDNKIIKLQPSKEEILEKQLLETQNLVLQLQEQLLNK